MYAVPKLLMRHLPRHYPFVSHLRLMSTWSIRWTGLIEFGLRLLPLLHSPEDEGKLDQAKDRWSIHVYPPRSCGNPKGTEHIHWDQARLQRSYSIQHRVRVEESWQWLRVFARVWWSCQVRSDDMILLVVVADPLLVNRHEADKIMASLYLNDIQGTQE